MDNDDIFKKRTGNIESHMPTHGNGMSTKVCRSIAMTNPSFGNVYLNSVTEGSAILSEHV